MSDEVVANLLADYGVLLGDFADKVGDSNLSMTEAVGLIAAISIVNAQLVVSVADMHPELTPVASPPQ